MNNPSSMFRDSEISQGSLVFLCGAGGTGKTVVAKELEKAYGFVCVPSPVRSFYAKEGVTSETEFMSRTPQFRMEFHIKLSEFYRNFILEYIKGKTGAFVFERSPVCVLAYTLYHSQAFSLDFFNKQREKVDTFINDLIDDGHFVSIPFFPYPVPWSGTDSEDDGFRYVPGVKNFTVSALMLNLLRDMQITAQRLHMAAVLDGTPEERASGLAEELSGAINHAAG